MARLDAVLSKVSDTLAHSPEGEALADYLAHTIEFPLASISGDAHLEKAIKKLNELIDRPTLSSGDEMYLYALTDLVELYESEHIPGPNVRGVELLRHLMGAKDLQQQDLVPLLGSKSIVSAVLSGKRTLTLAQITKLSARFGLPADVFIDRSSVSGESSSAPQTTEQGR